MVMANMTGRVNNDEGLYDRYTYLMVMINRADRDYNGNVLYGRAYL